ncbi:MAG: transglycosylase SLT domain-containing protein [Thermodesulfobacteriota bacterium]
MCRKLLIMAVFLLTAAAPASGAIYTYTDAEGVIHFTNVPSDSRYRLLFGREPMPGYDGGRFDQHISTAASKYGVDPKLIKAVIKVESAFNHHAVSRKGAKGLMQLMPETIQDMQVGNPFDPRENIEGGTRYLKWLLDSFGELELALAAYNAGPGRVREVGGIPAIPETRQYVRKVLRAYQNFHAGL